MAISDDLQYCKSSKRWVGGSKKVKKHDDVILEWSFSELLKGASQFMILAIS